jgi:hypothetical protein
MTDRLRSVQGTPLEADVPDLLASIASAGEREARIRLWLEATLQQARVGWEPPQLYNEPGIALLQAWLASQSGDYSNALAHVAQAQSLCQARADIAASLLAQLVHAGLLLRVGDPAGARINAQAALGRATSRSRSDIAAHALNCLALIAWATGAPAAAQIHVQNALEMLGSGGDARLRTLLLLNLTAIRHAIGVEPGSEMQGHLNYLSCTDARHDTSFVRDHRLSGDARRSYLKAKHKSIDDALADYRRSRIMP